MPKTQLTTQPDSHSDTTSPTNSRDFDSARRIVNLLFTLNTTRHPISTRTIISDPDMGYGHASYESEFKKFQRDRAKLAERGIIIREIHDPNTPQSLESSWIIDREATHADIGLISTEDAEALRLALQTFKERPELPYRHVLERIEHKLGQLNAPEFRPIAPETPQHKSLIDAQQEAIMETLWTAYMLKRCVSFAYVSHSGHVSTRTLGIYGLFTLQGNTYLVGATTGEEPRTFRCDRIERLRAPHGSYHIPADFTLTDYLFFSFDFGGSDEPEQEVTMSLPATLTQEEVQTITHERGTLEQIPSTDKQNPKHTLWLWHISVKNIKTAARYCLSLSQRGVRPQAPAPFVEQWKSLIKQSLQAHEVA
ncbi:WYL domain-containing protein [Collinsella sp. zg1085]|uniref:helix-turn-helix transcriptional regulator n=1 Tax=Collinsella sp. zg1085 TaxID=2844380 RepID=UPI001C0D38F3|nr:WYL domain-containing protein [Collinsella sp. zg1085]QWT17590.1 WYL domain-containing protein [Collinsella sp. zg1085]